MKLRIDNDLKTSLLIQDIDRVEAFVKVEIQGEERAGFIQVWQYGRVEPLAIYFDKVKNLNRCFDTICNIGKKEKQNDRQ